MQTNIQETPPVIDSKMLRQTLSCFPTGVAIATTVSREGVPIGVTISSFNSVSMDPPLVLWSLASNAGSRDEYLAHKGFAINILASDQVGICRLFAGPERDRFQSLDWAEGLYGLPVIAGCAAILECSTYAVHDGGDHDIMVGKVENHSSTDHTPLLFAKGKLGAMVLSDI